MDPTRIIKLPGGNGRYLYNGYASFIGNDATVDVDVPFGSIESFQITAVGASLASGEQPYLNETMNSTNGRVSRDASRKVTVKRAVTTTAGLGFYYQAIGR